MNLPEDVVSYMKWAVSWIAMAMLAGCSAGSGRLGSYIASDDDAALMVQITSNEDGRVSGSVSVVMADANGKTTAATRPMSGTIEGDAVNLSVENGTGLSLVTGAFDGENMRLTFFGNGNSSQLNFTKSDAGKFEELANARRHRAAEKQQEIETAAAMKDRMEQRAKRQKSIDWLANDIFRKAQEIQDKSKKVDVVIAEYRVAYERAAKMQTAKRSINNGSADAAYRVSQIDYELNSLSGDVEGMHTQVSDYKRSLDDFMADTVSKSPQLLAECQADELLNCSRLSAGLQLLQTRYQQFQQGYERENATFKGKRS